MDLTNLSIKELHQGIEDETFSIPEILISFRQRFEETEPKIQAFLNYDWDQEALKGRKN